ncbi:hypothetical protein, conserved, partial [Babesia bigemina]
MKFDKILNLKITLNNNPTNILNNLCTGLETFLGFNSASKGYDGSGIVYSDLDRLCDGVMGFLFSIITDVKDDKNLTKYNNNIDTMLEKIKLAQYNRKNFDSSIREVSQGIKAWVRGVEERNESITKPLANLEKTLHGHASVEMDDNPITDQLSTWQGFSSIYLQEVEKSEIALDEIDDELRNEIAPKIELIKQVVDNFWNSVNDLGVYDSVKKLKDKFGAIPKIVNMEIGTQIQEVNNTLNDKFEKMFRDIHNLTQNKKSHINESLS